MLSRSKIATLLLPVMALAAAPVNASDYCARLTARLNQMPQLIGSTGAAHLKSESIFRLNRIEISIRRDMRRLQCPTNSVILMNGNQHACSELGEELATVRERKRQYQDLDPALTQTVDDGSGLKARIVSELKRAGCDLRGTQQDVEIIGNTTADTSETGFTASDIAWQPDGSAEEVTQDLGSVLGDDAEADYGTPEAYGMIEIRPSDPEALKGSEMASVTLPKLEGQDLLEQNGSVETLNTRPQPLPAPEKPAASQPLAEQPVAAVPERNYNPNDPKVRKVGPAFLAEQEDGIKLGAPESDTVVR